MLFFILTSISGEMKNNFLWGQLFGELGELLWRTILLSNLQSKMENENLFIYLTLRQLIIVQLKYSLLVCFLSTHINVIVQVQI